MLWGRIRKWLAQIADKRWERRYLTSDLVAYYWEGTVSTSHPVRDISCNGAYIASDERWHIGTLLLLTLQREPGNGDTARSVTVPCQVVRHGSDGMGVNFMLATEAERRAVHQFVRAATKGPSRRSRNDRMSGQAIVEFALIVPLVFLLLVNAVNFGGFIYCWIAVADAARAAGDYVCTNSYTIDGPATSQNMTNLVQNAMAAVPNYNSSNLQVNVCESDNGTITAFGPSSCSGSLPADPELIDSTSSTHYADIVIDVSYTFTPFFPGSSFLQFALPSLPSTIHRRVVMRWP